jgi:hypothetical protein
MHVHARVGGEGIRTCDLRFIKRGSQPIELPFGDITGGHCGFDKGPNWSFHPLTVS